MRFHLPPKSFIAALAIPCFLLLFACSRQSPGAKKPAAVKGVIDLRGWDFMRDGSINLDGEWEFCWDQSPEPSDFKDAGIRKGCSYITVPSLWKDYRAGGVSLPGKGHATYRLKILSGADKRPKTLVVNRIYSGYELWINGVLADAQGKAGGPAKTEEYYIYIHNKKSISFIPGKGTNEIIIHVHNSDYESGGIASPVIIEDREAALQKKSQKQALDMTVFGLLMFASIYNILLYFFRKKDTAPLYFGILCFAMAINTLNHQYPILSGPFSYPGNPYLINYITVLAIAPFCAMTIRSLFPDDFSRRVVIFFQILAAGVVIALFFVKFRMAEKIMHLYFIFAPFFILYGLYAVIRTIKNRRDDAVLFCIGFVAVFITICNDILYIMWIINTTNTFQYGIIMLCITTSAVISRRFSRALRTVEGLSKDLEAKNVSLSRLDRLKDQFLASTSHELRTPLHGMIGLSESMIDGAAGALPQKAVENLSLIASSGHRLAHMVNDLLDMASIQDNGLDLTLKPVDLHLLSDMVVKLSLPLIVDKPVEIINNIGQEIPAALADEDRIRQVLHNLIGNAIKFTNKGTIELSARIIQPEDADHGTGTGAIIEVSISDTGIGVPDEYREKIFDVYYQADGGDTRAYPGTGLGLAIAKQIVELHNGSIRVVSEKNRGSVFTFTLPASNEPVPDNPDAVSIESMSGALPADETPGRRALPAGIAETAFGNNPVLLVVDDDPVNVRVLRNYFESKQCVVKTAPDGIAALDIVGHDDSIDLVLLDIMMPVMSGYEVCRRIRENHSPEELPVIMLTAKNMMADINTAFEAGANDYIVKPFRITELLARVSTMLALRNVRKSAAEGITIRDRNRAYSLTFGEIIYITSHSRNIIVHTDEQDITVPVLIREIIHRLPPDMFIRIHKSHIINLRYIRSITHVMSGRYRVRLRDNDDTELPVGRAYLEGLRKKI